MATTEVLNLSSATKPVTIVPWNDAAVTYLPKMERWRLERTFVFFDDSKRCAVTVYAGLLYDLSSITRLVWVFIAPFELGTAPPAAHDALYQSCGKPSEWLSMMYTDPERINEPVTYTQAETDCLFNQMMKDKLVTEWRRRVAYRAVRMFGRFYWNKGTR